MHGGAGLFVIEAIEHFQSVTAGGRNALDYLVGQSFSAANAKRSTSSTGALGFALLFITASP
jgi:hypothetical protein